MLAGWRLPKLDDLMTCIEAMGCLELAGWRAGSRTSKTLELEKLGGLAIEYRKSVQLYTKYKMLCTNIRPGLLYEAILIRNHFAIRNLCIRQ